METMLNKSEMITKKDRFDLKGCNATMKAVVTTGNGGYDKLEYRDVPVPTLGPGEVLLQVLAAGVNNTEINTNCAKTLRTREMMPRFFCFFSLSDW